MASIMYEQYVIMQYSEEDIQEFKMDIDQANAFSYNWLKLETASFYMYVMAAVVYLLYIQLRGIFGFDDEIKKKDRYKSDALEYYEQDIHWFAFSFSMLGSSLRNYETAFKQIDFEKAQET